MTILIEKNHIVLKKFAKMGNFVKKSCRNSKYNISYFGAERQNTSCFIQNSDSESGLRIRIKIWILKPNFNSVSESGFSIRILILNPDSDSESGFRILIQIQNLNSESGFKTRIRIRVQKPD